LGKTWHVGGVTIVGVPFCGLKEDHGDMTQNPTGVKIMQSNKNSTQLYSNFLSSELKNLVCS